MKYHVGTLSLLMLLLTLFTALLIHTSAWAASRNVDITVGVPVQSIPAGLPHHFSIGVKNTQAQLSLMTGVGFDFRYQYMNNGWQSYNSPAGQNASMYAADSITNGIIPVYTYYYLGSTYPPGTGAGDLFSSTGMQGASQMGAMYTDYVLLMQKIQGAYNWDASQVFGGGTTPVYSTDNSVASVATIGGSDSIVHSRVFKSSGKWLFRITNSGTAGIGEVGLSANSNGDAFLGNSNSSVGYSGAAGNVYLNNVTLATIAPYTTGAVIDVAVDLTAKLIWFRVNSGNWNNSGAANPVTGAGGISIAGISSSLTPAAEMNANGAAFTTSFLNPFTLSGFSSWAQNTVAMVTLEPDLFAYMQQQYGDDATIIPASAASATGYSGVSLAGLPNTAPGYAQAMVRITKFYAPSVLIGPNQPRWGPSNGYDPASSSTGAAQTTGGRVGNFQHSLNAAFDLSFYDISDRDSAYLPANAPTNNWWNATAFENFRQYLIATKANTGLYGMFWQTPVGNTLYQSVNNTAGHFQDDRPEFFLASPGSVANSPVYNAANITNFIQAGIIGVLFGGGQDGQPTNSTEYYDQMADGITNPGALGSQGNPLTAHSNGATATVSDDDGGFLRLATQKYYLAPAPIP